MLMSAEEARNMQFRENTKRNEKELNKILEEITTEIKEGNGKTWINVDNMSDATLDILETLGYECDKYCDIVDGQKFYYTIYW